MGYNYSMVTIPTKLTERQQQFVKRYDRLNILWQWVQQGSVTCAEFKEMISWLPAIEAKQVGLDSLS
jgi:hypothetical protein